MVAGVRAAAIVSVFVTFSWSTVKAAAGSWVGKGRDTVLGTNIR